MSEDATVAIITSAKAKALLGITGSTEDTIVDDIVNRCSKFAASYCGKKTFRKATYTEYYDGNGCSQMYLKNYPVNSVASLYNADATRTFDANTLVDSAADLVVDKESGQLRLWNNGGLFIAGKANVKVVYVAGYTIGATGAEIELPYELIEAGGLMVMYSYKRHYQDKRVGLKSETVGERTLTYENEDIPVKAKAILDGYRNYVGVAGFAYAD